MNRIFNHVSIVSGTFYNHYIMLYLLYASHVVQGRAPADVVITMCHMRTKISFQEISKASLLHEFIAANIYNLHVT